MAGSGGEMEPTSGWIRDPNKYKAYVDRTNEKEILKSMITRAYYQGQLPIKPGDSGKRVLDLGCGIGANTSFLASLFDQHDVHAVERSREFLAFAEDSVINPGNTTFYCAHFEDFAKSGYDFILCSHVLQYIDGLLDEFLLRLRDALAPDGEAWIVLQEEVGINQIVSTAIPYLSRPSPYLMRWFVHSHVRGRLAELGVAHDTAKFVSIFKAPDFVNPTGKDKLCLEFFLLEEYQGDNDGLRAALADLGGRISVDGYVRHEVGITRIRR